VIQSKRAFKFLDDLDGKTRKQIITDLDKLSNYGSYDTSLDLCKLKGQKDYYRLGTGKMRIIFMLDKSAQLILVRKIAYREAAYE
jgi:mRNA-degrading endonuclease RelE of RelBE toxin-antitoxin system